jgi:hypothetical protein
VRNTAPIGGTGVGADLFGEPVGVDQVPEGPAAQGSMGGSAARRLSAIHDQTQLDLARLRQEVADLCGSTTAARAVRDAVEVLLGRVRNLNRLSSDLMLDAYERDIGGD